MQYFAFEALRKFLPPAEVEVARLTFNPGGVCKVKRKAFATRAAADQYFINHNFPQSSYLSSHSDAEALANGSVSHCVPNKVLFACVPKQAITSLFDYVTVYARSRKLLLICQTERTTDKYSK